MATSSTTAAPIAAPPFDASSNLGGILIGLVISTMLFGMALLQAYVYFTNFLGHRETRDKSVLRFTVIAICLLNAIINVVNIDMVHGFVVSVAKQEDILTKPTWNFRIVGFLKTFLIWLVQSIYLSRIYIIMKELMHRGLRHTLLVAYVTMVAVISIVAGILFIIGIAWQSNTNSLLSLTEMGPKYLVGTGELITAAVDTIIAVFLALVLRSSRTGIARTDRVLVRLYIYLHTSGILISAISIIGTVFFLVLPNNLAFLSTGFIEPNVYTVSLLLLLNTRPSLRQEMNAVKLVSSSVLNKAPPSTDSEDGYSSKGRNFSSPRFFYPTEKGDAALMMGRPEIV